MVGGSLSLIFQDAANTGSQSICLEDPPRPLSSPGRLSSAEGSRANWPRSDTTTDPPAEDAVMQAKLGSVSDDRGHALPKSRALRPSTRPFSQRRSPSLANEKQMAWDSTLDALAKRHRLKYLRSALARRKETSDDQPPGGRHVVEILKSSWAAGPGSADLYTIQEQA